MAKIYHTLVNPDTLPSLKQRQTWLECAEKKPKKIEEKYGKRLDFDLH